MEIMLLHKGVKEYIMEKEGFNYIYSIKSLEFVRPLYVIFNDKRIRDIFREAQVEGGFLIR